MPAGPDATPEEKFQAWLTGQEASGALDRPRRGKRPVLNAALLMVGVAIWGTLGWALVKNAFG